MSSPNVVMTNKRTIVDNSRNDVFGATVTKVSGNVPGSFTPPAADYLTLEHVVEYLDGAAKRFTITKTSEWPTLSHQEEETTTGKKVTVTRSFHSTEPDIGVNGTARIVESVKPINKRLWLKTSREIHSSVVYNSEDPTTIFTEYHSVDYYFPSYLDKTHPFNLLALGVQTIVSPNKSGDHNFKIPARFEITYHTTPPVAEEVFQFKTVDITLITKDFSIREENVITDGGSMNIIQAGEEDTEGNQYMVSMDFTWPASSPTTTEYEDMMGDEVLVAEDSTRWKYNLWRRVKVYMKLPNLTLGLDGSLIY